MVGEYKNEGAKMVFQNHTYCQLCLENRSHTCVCGLFQVIKLISSDLYVYELTGKNVILHKALGLYPLRLLIKIIP